MRSTWNKFQTANRGKGWSNTDMASKYHEHKRSTAGKYVPVSGKHAPPTSPQVYKSKLRMPVGMSFGKPKNDDVYHAQTDAYERKVTLSPVNLNVKENVNQCGFWKQKFPCEQLGTECAWEKDNCVQKNTSPGVPPLLPAVSGKPTKLVGHPSPIKGDTGHHPFTLTWMYDLHNNLQDATLFFPLQVKTKKAIEHIQNVVWDLLNPLEQSRSATVKFEKENTTTPEKNKELRKSSLLYQLQILNHQFAHVHWEDIKQISRALVRNK